MVGESRKLATGSRVAIVGGGPAGSFFALYLSDYARGKGIEPQITIYQQRGFDACGPVACKGCAGILSLSLLKNLGELGLTIPEQIVQSHIEHYTVHSPYTSISISNPDREIRIASVYRGGGPRVCRGAKVGSFDLWLLEEAQKRGARVELQKVSVVDLEHGPQIEVGGTRLEYDLVVLATGVNSRTTVRGLRYIPPRTRTMAQDELYAGPAEVAARLGKAAHAFLLPRSGLIFGTLVPKGAFINVSVLSGGKHPVSVTDFIEHPMVKEMVAGDHERACGCRPRAAISAARNYFCDGFVAVGDAAVSRLYKDGIGSALLTAREAARTVVNHGFSHQDFARHYQPFCQGIDRDNRWGRLLFWINDKTKNSRAFLLAQHRLISNEQNNVRGPQTFTRAAWGMFTGSYPYRSIARMTFNPVSVIRLTAALIWEGFRGWFRQGAGRRRMLHVARRKVLILGSGFGGTFVLRHLVPALNRNESVETTMVSDENFFLFSPLLDKVAMGAIETRHIAYPIRRLHWRDRFNFIQSTVQKIDLANRRVTTAAGDLDFDYLVMALGGVTRMPESYSALPNVFTLRTLGDSMLIRNHIVGVFEQANAERDPERRRQLLTFVVCGAGYIGIQVVAELRDFIHRGLLRVYRTIDTGSVRLLLVESNPRIVARLHGKMGAYVMKHLKDRGIEVRMKSQLTRLGDDSVEINGAEVVPTDTVIWVAGIVANPRVAELDVEKDGLGRVLVNEYLEIPGVQGVYALGDCAHFPLSGLSRAVPPSAHVAVRQAKVVAHNILAEIRGWDKRPYRYSNPVQMVSLGSSRAVFRFGGLRLYGFPARVVWLTVYTLLVTGTYNRIRVITDWLLSLLFGRDTTLLKLRK